MTARTARDEEQPGHRALRLKSGLIAAILVAIGLALTLLYESAFHSNPGILGTVVHHLSTAFLIAGLWHAIEVFFARKEFFEAMAEVFTKSLAPMAAGQRKTDSLIHDLQDQVRASRHERILGFTRSYVESHPELYDDIVTKSATLTLLLNNGYVWIHSHRDELKERFADPAKYTRLIVLLPGSEAAGLMEAKENLVKGGYAQKIEEAFSLLESMLPDLRRLEVFGVTIPIVQAIFMSESRALVVPRFTLEPSVPPVFEFEKNDHKKSYYKRVHDDVEHLLRHPETKRLTLTSSGPAPASLAQAAEVGR